MPFVYITHNRVSHTWVTGTPTTTCSPVCHVLAYRTTLSWPTPSTHTHWLKSYNGLMSSTHFLPLQQRVPKHLRNMQLGTNATRCGTLIMNMLWHSLELTTNQCTTFIATSILVYKKQYLQVSSCIAVWAFSEWLMTSHEWLSWIGGNCEVSRISGWNYECQGA